MSIQINGSQLSATSVNNLQPTDFSKVTAHPEFVVKGKTFYDETGQLQVGTLERYGTTSGSTGGSTDADSAEKEELIQIIEILEQELNNCRQQIAVYEQQLSTIESALKTI